MLLNQIAATSVFWVVNFASMADALRVTSHSFAAGDNEITCEITCDRAPIFSRSTRLAGQRINSASTSTQIGRMRLVIQAQMVCPPLPAFLHSMKGLNCFWRWGRNSTFSLDRVNESAS